MVRWAGWLRQHNGQAPSIETASELIDGVLAGLAHLHGRHIIHRDLKPDNILLQHETPRLADFGIARLLKTGSYSSNVSGTFAYMAPEAFNGKRNEQTDVWSAGVIFYQMLRGACPTTNPIRHHWSPRSCLTTRHPCLSLCPKSCGSW